MRNSGTKSFKFWNFRNIKELFNLENWLSLLQTVRPICPDVPSLDPRNTYFDISREFHRSTLEHVCTWCPDHDEFCNFRVSWFNENLGYRKSRIW